MPFMSDYGRSGTQGSPACSPGWTRPGGHGPGTLSLGQCKDHPRVAARRCVGSTSLASRPARSKCVPAVRPYGSRGVGSARRAGGSGRLLAVAGLQNVWVCAQDLALIRADRIISLVVPVATGYGAAPLGDHALHRAVWAQIEASVDGAAPTQVKLADCGTPPAGELLAGLVLALGAASRPTRSAVACSSSPNEIRRGSRGGRLPANCPLSGHKVRPRAPFPWLSRCHPLSRQPGKPTDLSAGDGGR